MAITLVATAGNASANTYATLAEATAYAEGRLDVAPWDDLTDTQQGRLLVQSTQVIDTLPLTGVQHSDAEENECPLHFPTALCEDDDGNLYIPDEVRDATCEVAFGMARVLSGGTSSYSDLRAAGIQSMSEGAVSVTFTADSQSQNANAAGLSAFKGSAAEDLMRKPTEENGWAGWIAGARGLTTSAVHS